MQGSRGLLKKKVMLGWIDVFVFLALSIGPNVILMESCHKMDKLHGRS